MAASWNIHWNQQLEQQQHTNTDRLEKIYQPSADILCGRLPRADLDLWPFERKIGAPVTPALRNVHAIFDFSVHLLIFDLRARMKQTDKT